MKKWTTIVLAVLVVALITGLACLSSAAATTENVLVNGVDLVSDADHTVACGDGTAVYDPATRTLTLTDAEITVGSRFNSGNDVAGVYLSGHSDSVTVVLVGENSITLTDSNYRSNGIYVNSRADFYMKGTGSLSVKIRGSHPYAVYLAHCSGYFKDVTLDCSLAEGSGYTGGVIEHGSYDSASPGPFEIELDNVDLKASGYMVGVFSIGGLSVKDSDINIATEDAALYAEMNGMLIENSTVTASAVYDDCSAICSWGDTGIENSTVIATAKGNAIYSYGDVLISEGSDLDLVSTGSDGFTSSHGITVSGGSFLTVEGLWAGVYTGEIFSVVDGYVSMMGVDAALYARRVLSGSSSAAPSESPVAVALGSDYAAQDGLTVYTEDWDYTEVWDSWEWDYVYRWQSYSYFVDGEGDLATTVVIDLRPADYTAVNEALAAANALNKDWYKDVSALEAAVNAVDFTKNFREQQAVDAMAKAINDAILALEIKSADYSEVDKAVADAAALDPKRYVDFSAVIAALNAVDRTKDISEQDEVDAMAKAIKDAMAALVWGDADYTEVDNAVAAPAALNPEDYKDFSSVLAAVAAVVEGKKADEQDAVDAMAKAINDAIAALVPDPADYTELNAVIAKAKALNKDHYYDFSKVEAALAKVDLTKNAKQQPAVDFMADAIESAMGFLKMKPADYSAVDAAIAAAEKLDKSSYKDFSKVEAAIAAVVTGKMIDEQAAVDAMAKAINDAVAALESINPATSDYVVAGIVLLAAAAAVTGFVVIRKRRNV